jgi:argonaute-like protein implicated in RNA metabolism and viral defense
MIGLGKEALLFTRGSVPIYRTYPGMRVPRPIMIRPYSLDTPMGDVARDILALTKMNWNSTQFDGTLPIPIRAARQVGKVLRHVPIGQKEATEYPYYM